MRNRQSQCISVGQSRLLVFICVVILTAIFTPSHAEEVLLKNGSIFTGRVSKITAEDVFITTEKGQMNIAKADIVRIQYVPFTPEQKAKALEVQRKKKAAEAIERERIRQFRESKERKRREEELDAKIRKEKEEEARMASLRAAALRELVAKGQMEKPADEPISYWDFAWRSIVLPGWGHFYLDRPWFGVFYAGGTVALLGAVVETRNEALSAKRENDRDAKLNFILTIQPGLVNRDLSVTYGLYTNAKAFTQFQHKVDQYNGAWVALATFYCVQIIHIIYNGFAWENGLLIVDNQKEAGTIDAHFSVAPDHLDKVSKPGVSFQGGLTVAF